MQRNIDAGLSELKQHLVQMAGYVEMALEKVSLAWQQQSAERVKDVYAIEESVNASHKLIDAECFRLLATQQPMATDLRWILATIKMNNDLERMVDQTVNICHNLEYYLGAPASRVEASDIQLMSMEVKNMVRSAIDAFVRQDEILARNVIRADDRVDDLKDSVFRTMVAHLKKHPECIERGLTVILIARNLERIGDHATNIAEDVVFSSSGEDIRHHGLTQSAGGKP